MAMTPANVERMVCDNEPHFQRNPGARPAARPPHAPPRAAAPPPRAPAFVERPAADPMPGRGSGAWGFVSVSWSGPSSRRS